MLKSLIKLPFSQTFIVATMLLLQLSVYALLVFACQGYSDFLQNTGWNVSVFQNFNRKQYLLQKQYSYGILALFI